MTSELPTPLDLEEELTTPSQEEDTLKMLVPERDHGNMQRHLLFGLRTIMAGHGTVSQLLNKIVTLVAGDMETDVCSIYIRRLDDVLELSATIGLRQEAVRQTRLKMGEGVVGSIALTGRPYALANAPADPNFSYRPETGEDPYFALMGVPIIRLGKVRGVLVIQNKEKRPWAEEEIELLETVAMVLADLIGAQAELNREVGENTDQMREASTLLPKRIDGVCLNSGFAVGWAILHRQQLTVRQIFADNPEEEKKKLDQSIQNLLKDMDTLERYASRIGTEPSEIIESYRMFANDKGWHRRLYEAISGGLTAEAAIQRVQRDMQARLGQANNPYVRAKLADLNDVSHRLLRHMTGARKGRGSMPKHAIIVAKTIGPAELLDYDPSVVRGLVLEDGGAASHAAIIAKSIGIPVLGQCADILSNVETLDRIIVDANNAHVMLRPDDDVLEGYINNVRALKEVQKGYETIRNLPAISQDDVSVAMLLNCGLQIDMPHLHTLGADGVGLYRTEIPFMVRSSYPDVEAQTKIYARIIETAQEKPVVFRTLDVGGDKVLPYASVTHGEEENPALGWRAIRIGLDRPAMLRKQLRAMIQAASGSNLSIMFPMVADISEFVRARHLLDLELARMIEMGHEPPLMLRVGVMLEVPSLVWQLDNLLPLVDFISVGTNDLMQYFFATDRDNSMMTGRYDVLSPAFLNFMRYIVEKCTYYNRPITVCGEMAGKPLDAMALLAIGVRRLSMSPPSLGAVKAMVRSVHVGQLEDVVNTLCESTRTTIRPELRSFAIDRQIII